MDSLCSCILKGECGVSRVFLQIAERGLYEQQLTEPYRYYLDYSTLGDTPVKPMSLVHLDRLGSLLPTTGH